MFLDFVQDPKGPLDIGGIMAGYDAAACPAAEESSAAAVCEDIGITAPKD